MKEYDSVPESVRSHPSWILWRSESDGTKMPVDTRGKRIDPHDKTKHRAFDEILRDLASSRDATGIGLVLTKGCGLVGLDFDKVSTWKDEARPLIEAFEGRGYMEKSPSGDGVRILVRGKLPKGHKTRSKHFHGGKVEVYTKKRFLTITGDRGRGDTNKNETDFLLSFTEPLCVSEANKHSLTVPGEQLPQRISDEDVMFEMASMAAAERPGAVAFMRIHRDGFDSDEDPSDSLTSAVSSLVTVTKNFDQVRRILEASEHLRDYRDRRTGTPKLSRWIQNEVPKILGRRIRTEEEDREQRAEAARDGGGSGDSYFEDFVWVKSEGSFYSTATGFTYTKANLNDSYRHVHTGTRGDPLLANLLLDQPELTRVDGKAWIPGRHGEAEINVLRHNGAELVNTWRGFEITPERGDVEPWLKLLEHLVEDEFEREQVLKRMAFDVQFPDLKCNWHVVMIGVYGAGKDSLLMPLAKIFGEAFSTIGNEALKSPYDDGLAKKKIVHVNEVKGLSGTALERVKRLTATHSGGWETLNIKSEKQIRHPNLWSFYFLTNHDDAMNVDEKERRFFVVNARKPMPEPLRDEYFGWLEKRGGARSLFDFLLRVDLGDFETAEIPARTEAFRAMVENSKSDAQTDMDDIFSQGNFGFDTGLVNVKHVATSIKQRGSYCRPADVKKALEKLEWRQLDHVGTALKKVGGKTKRLPLTWFAPGDSILHLLEGSELYDEVERIRGAGDFLED